MNLYLYLKHFPPLGNDLNEGTRKAVHGLATGLVHAGATVTILCEGIVESTVRSQYGYMIRCFHNPRSRASDAISNSASFRLAPSVEAFIKTLQKDNLVILNGIFHRSVYSLSRLLKKYSVPYVVAPHDPYHPAIFKKNAHLKLPYWHLFEKRVLQQALAIQVLDKRHSEWLQQLHIQTPVIEVPNGFSPKDVHSESTLKWSSQGTVNLFFLGRLDTYNKGLDLLLEAFAQVAQVADIKLVIQGPDWGDRATLEAQTAKLGLTDKVTFLKPEYDRSPSQIIADYDIFCIPSRFEGFSLSALEAMLSARVIAISDIAGLAPHVVASQCGVVVQSNVAAIAAGLQNLLKCRSDWQSMGLRGRNYALTRLDWKHIGAVALKDYNQLLGQVHSPASPGGRDWL